MYGMPCGMSYPYAAQQQQTLVRQKRDQKNVQSMAEAPASSEQLRAICTSKPTRSA